MSYFDGSLSEFIVDSPVGLVGFWVLLGSPRCTLVGPGFSWACGPSPPLLRPYITKTPLTKHHYDRACPINLRIIDPKMIYVSSEGRPHPVACPVHKK